MIHLLASSDDHAVFAIPIFAILVWGAVKIAQIFRSNPAPSGLRGEEKARLERIGQMLDKMESRVEALETILHDSSAQKPNQPADLSHYEKP